MKLVLYHVQSGREADLVSIRFRALGAGDLVFTGDPADTNGTEVLLRGRDEVIPG